LKSDGESQYTWQWQTEKVEMIEQNLQNDEMQLESFMTGKSNIKD